MVSCMLYQLCIQEKRPHWTENQIGTQAILLMAMMRKIRKTLVRFEYHSRNS